RIAIGFFIDRRATGEIGIDTGCGIVVHAFDAVLQAYGVDAELAGKVFQSGSLGEVTVPEERFYILAAWPDHAHAVGLGGLRIRDQVNGSVAAIPVGGIHRSDEAMIARAFVDEAAAIPADRDDPGRGAVEDEMREYRHRAVCATPMRYRRPEAGLVGGVAMIGANAEGEIVKSPGMAR